MKQFADLGPCIIEEFGGQGCITVRRFTGGAWDGTGRFSGSASTDTPTAAAVQPMPPKEAEKLPENERTKEGIMIFTVGALLTSDVSTQGRADRVFWEGKEYEVVHVESWSGQANYVKSLATRVGA